MATKITRDVIESHLHCKLKSHLKLAGAQGTRSDYEAMLIAARDEVRLRATEKILTRHNDGEVARHIALTTAVLKQGPAFILDAALEDDLLALTFDGLKRVDGASKLGDFHYVPVLFHEGEKARKEQRFLLEVYGLLLSRVQGRMPCYGVLWQGKECRAARIRLSPDPRKAERVLQELQQLRGSDPPRLLLNDHCQQCEFRERCHAQAVQEDNLSLLRGMSEKEVGRQNQKGIFTVTQLSFTFRVRRRDRRAKSQTAPHAFALQALAVRERKIHVQGSFTVPCAPTAVYLDMEGIPERGLCYLIGLVVVENGAEIRHSFWADDEVGQLAIFSEFLETLTQYKDYRLYHFGNYEIKTLRRIKALLPEHQQARIDHALARAVNVLSLIHPHVYFPTCSNRLKDIGRYLGCQWSEPASSGLQSIAWRLSWEKTRDESLKAMLLRYNTEDCLALKAVVDVLIRIAPGRAAGEGGDGPPPVVVLTQDLRPGTGRGHRFGKKDSELPGFDFVNECAYFDHQREKVFVRTNLRLKAINKQRQKTRRPALRVNKVIELSCKRCPACNSKKIVQVGGIFMQVIDLRYSKTGVKRWVTKYLSCHYSCARCRTTFIPPGLPPLTTKYGRGLISWCIYHNVARGQNMLQVAEGLKDLFNLSLGHHQLYRFKTAVADYYQPAYARILREILASPLLHVDETEVDLRGRKGYVWVLATMERVYFFYRDSREGAFLKEMLKGFAGVLISDFYTAYDSLDCPQQKCLIHLLRDLNEDVRKNPYDQELKTLAQQFAALLKGIVETIDRFGLKKSHLKKHKTAVDAFFAAAAATEATSEVARGYQKRFAKYRGKLFTFLEYDGVPWNNNNAEHAIHCFARYRRFADGRFTELSINDYLVILSVYQSCEYQGINFLDYLRGKGEEGAGHFGSGKRIIPGTATKPSSPEQSAPTPEPNEGSPVAEPIGGPAE